MGGEGVVAMSSARMSCDMYEHDIIVMMVFLVVRLEF